MRIGPYEVLGELGRGGMGVVYRVRGPDGHDAALKVLVRTDTETIARFERERRLLASLGEEEGFVPLLDAGVSEGGAAWLVMPFLPGGTLRAKLAKGPLGVAETVELGRVLARALGAAHARGIVHRDVKPENILFTAPRGSTPGRALVADLGLAKHFDRTTRGASQSVSLSREGMLRGTAGYMAPEQVSDAKGAGPAADVFALGAVLYECLAGRPAFWGETVVETLARLSAGVPPIERPEVPGWLREVVTRALAPDPRARFADGGALARALDAGGGKRAPRRGLTAALALGVTVAAVLLVAVAFALSAGPREVSPRGPAAPAPRPPEPRSPGPAHALSRRALEKARARDLDGAIADATQAIELDPKDTLAWTTRAAARDDKGDSDGAIDDYTRALELVPELAPAWANRGIAKISKRDFAAAIPDLDRAIELDPGSVVVWIARGSARGKTGDVAGEIADETKALELDPTAAKTWANRGMARFRKGDTASAISDLSRAIELDPTLARAWMSLGSARARSNDMTEAIRDYTKAIELDPKYAPAFLNRGISRGVTGDLKGEIDDETKAIELDPESADAYTDRGVAKGRSGDSDGEIDDYTKAIEIDPRSVLAWKNRGLANYTKTNFKKAVRDLETALQLAPDGPEAATIQRALDLARKRVP
jgi:tetratricopeptide (TPR) repeat protein